MKYADRSGNRWTDDNSQDNFLKFIYSHAITRGGLKLVTKPSISKLGGKFLSSKFSKRFIKGFVESNHIDLSQYEKNSIDEFISYNDFFTRKIKSDQRPIDKSEDSFIAPCDSKLTCCPITPDGSFYIKHTYYTLKSLLRDEDLANKFVGGNVLIFRLTVDDYHRYCYVDHGQKGSNIFISGLLHTVNPVANDVYPIYKENSREYCLIHSENFGDIIQMEVGALMVGKISNCDTGEKRVEKGSEKGYFEFGGSTVIVITTKDAVTFDTDILQNSADGYETKVLMGSKIGTKK